MVYIEQVKIIDPRSSLHQKDVQISQDESGKLIFQVSSTPAHLYCLPKIIDACCFHSVPQIEESMKAGAVQYALIHDPKSTPTYSTRWLSPILYENRADLDLVQSVQTPLPLPLYLPYSPSLNYEELYFLFQQIGNYSIPVIKQTCMERGVPNMPTLHGFLLGTTQLTFQPEIAQLAGLTHLLSQFPQINVLLSPFFFPEWDLTLPNLYYDIPIGSLIYKDTDFHSYTDLVRFPFPLLSEEQITRLKHFIVSHPTALLTSHHAVSTFSYPEPYSLQPPHFNGLPYLFLLAYNALVLEEYLTLDDLVERLCYSPSRFLNWEQPSIEQRALDEIFFFDPGGETVCQLHPHLPEKRLKGKIIFPN